MMKIRSKMDEIDENDIGHFKVMDHGSANELGLDFDNKLTRFMLKM